MAMGFSLLSRKYAVPEAERVRSTPEVRQAAVQIVQSLDRLRGYVRRRLRDAQEAEDVVQETLARVIAQEERQVIEQPLAYAFRVADSVIIAQARQRLRSRHQEADDNRESMALDLACSLPLADEVLDYRERLARFEAALAGLTEQRRAVFRLRHLEGRSRQEIAEAMGLSLEAVKKNLVRAMADMMRALGDDLDEYTKERSIGGRDGGMGEGAFHE
ncbi:RNA polymerase sigma factor [Novosphingobium sp. 9]|uniref:RNA polymerase sigma factor n=1 Tax=Novosphingobium sp. 9 TaxID=2025349 RepID=UPI0021B54A6F|nr:RNA polymerase sigma factor [Novosphingobium sp. 9]